MTSKPQPITDSSLRFTVNFGRDILGAPIRYFDRFGDTFTASLLGESYIMTRDPAWITEVLVKQDALFKKDKVTKSISLLSGNGLLTNDGASWRPRRKMMQPHFQPQALEPLLPLFHREAESSVAKWPLATSFDLVNAMTELTMRSALSALFGVNGGDVAGIERATAAGMRYFSGLGGTMIPLPLWIPTKTNRSFKIARRNLLKEVDALILRARRESTTNTPISGLRKARDEKRLTDAELRDEAVTLLVAGHDPSAATLAFTLAALASHPLEQEKIAAELRERGIPTSLKALMGSSALKRALLESLRLYPSSWAIGREAREEVSVFGHRVKKGTQVTIHQWAAHRHPTYFESPDVFEPDRWTEEFAGSLPKGLFIPWGTGPRVCIGNHFSMAQMMMSLAVILSRYRLEIQSPFPGKLCASITVSPPRPLLVTATRR